DQSLDAYRRQVREWFQANVPADWTERQSGCTEEEFLAFQREWFGKLRSAGLALPHWPKAWGGQDLSVEYQAVIYEEIARSNGPRPVLYFLSLYHLPGTLLHWGTEEQKQRYLPGVL